MSRAIGSQSAAPRSAAAVDERCGRQPGEPAGRRQGALRAVALAGLAAFLGACSASTMKAGPVGPAPTTIDEAIAQLEAAEGDVDRLLAGGGAQPQQYAAPPPAYTSPGYGAQPPAAGGEPVPPAAPPPAVAPARGAAGGDGAAAVQASSPNDPCWSACRALASMERAAAHLCSLAGSGDARCASAQTRLRQASDRVHAGCPSCST